MFLLIISLILNFSFSTELEIPVEDSKIYGTLENPESSELVLIISGSGPTDRNGNSSMLNGDNNSLKYLAEELSKQGFATFRYDKRMVAKSKGFKGEDSTLFVDFVDDAVKVVEFVRSKRKYKTLSIIGHSEGAFIGALAANRLKADKFVSLCGLNESIDTTVINQIKERAPAMVDEVKEIFNTLNAGKTLDSINPMLYSIFRPSIQPFIINMLSFDLENTYKNIKAKKLFISGGHDIQIYSEDVEKLAKICNAKYEDFPEMNHVLKKTPKTYIEQISSYSNPELPLYDGLVDSISNFIKSK